MAVAWLALGVIALLGSGLLAILLVGSRTPALQHVLPWRDFFHTALVIHVDLSVLIWFLAFAGVLWSIGGSPRAARLGWVAWTLCVAGTGVLILAPFVAEGNPLMNNYVPVLRQPFFLVGLALVALGFVALTVRALATVPFTLAPESAAGALSTGVFLSAAAAALALVAFAWSQWSLPAGFEGQSYYEMLFWGGGHVLQFVHALLLCTGWLVLADAAGMRVTTTPPRIAALFLLAAAPAALTPVLYLTGPVGSAGHIIGFTNLMKFGHLAMLPLGVVLLAALWRGRRRIDAREPSTAALLCSLGLFAVGGVLGFMIHGIDVVIPAHYHGSIVGVTLAFMGLTYHLLPRLGFGEPMKRTARWQAYVYASGQFLHIAGLAWSGGYGVQRKVAGAGQVLRSTGEVVGMGLMGLGGLIAIIGGVMFVVVCLHSMARRRTGSDGAPVVSRSARP